jgi:3-hydroxybutyryl-CoA dehydratase
MSSDGRKLVRVYHVDQELVESYAKVSGDHNPLHTDPAFAATTHFGRTIAHGMMTLAFVSDSLELWCGAAWTNGGAIEATFLSPVFPGDDVEVSAIETTVEAPARVCAIACRAGERAILSATARWTAPESEAFGHA